MSIADGNRAVRLIFIAENLSAHTDRRHDRGDGTKTHIY